MRLKNIFSFAVTNLWRNKFLSLATVIIIALILFTFNIILSIHLIAETGLDDIQQKVDIILYIKDDGEPLQIEKFIEEIKDIESVKEVVYTSKEDALRNLLNKYPIAIDPFSKYSIENPLPANINIITYSVENHSEILELADSNNYRNLFVSLKESTENQKIVGKLVKITDSSKRILISTLIIFVIASILIVSNAITLSIYYKRNELDVMKLVGASPGAMRAPFVIEGIVYGFVGFVSSMILLYGFLRVTELDLISFSLNVELFQFVILELTCCVLIGLISGVLSTEKYLRIKK
ncbi:MAG: permease-like cell division protein FtsX [Candidatus Peregrinibacteria bacterium]|nr:permease-like cell division protein FtsX [Candidatus Peregrinibacteria bacterium]MDZ4245039.1 permease-like cell division protein FtsX [Candidatus Gracilibacteria bacterium]